MSFQCYRYVHCKLIDRNMTECEVLWKCAYVDPDGCILVKLQCWWPPFPPCEASLKLPANLAINPCLMIADSLSVLRWQNSIMMTQWWRCLSQYQTISFPEIACLAVMVGIMYVWSMLKIMELAIKLDERTRINEDDYTSMGWCHPGSDYSFRDDRGLMWIITPSINMRLVGPQLVLNMMTLPLLAFRCLGKILGLSKLYLTGLWYVRHFLK